MKLAYLPQPGSVRLRITAKGKDKEILEKLVEKEITKLNHIIPGVIVCYDEEQIESVI